MFQVVIQSCPRFKLHSMFHFVLNISATGPTFVINVTLPVLVHIQSHAIDIFISHDLLPSDLVAQSVEQR